MKQPWSLLKSRKASFRKRDAERGGVAVIAAICLFMLLAFCGLAFSLGQMMDVRVQLQTASEAAALAAARDLNGTADGLVRAKVIAASYSANHVAYDETVKIGDPDIEFGRWHYREEECTFGGVAPCFEPMPAGAHPRWVTAVKVENGRDGGATRNSPLDLAFGVFLGRPTTKAMTSYAIAISGGPGAPGCALPFAAPMCEIVTNPGNQLKCGTTFPLVLGPTNGKWNEAYSGMGYVNLYPDELNHNAMKKFVIDQIRNQGCVNGERQYVGDTEVKLMEGQGDLKSVIDALLGLDDKGKNNGTDSDCLIGTVQTIAVTDGGNSNGGSCPFSPKTNPSQDVLGFVNVRIVGMSSVGNTPTYYGKCPLSTAPVTPPSPLISAAMWVKIECDAEPTNGGGEEDLGGGADFEGNGTIRLVQ